MEGVANAVESLSAAKPKRRGNRHRGGLLPRRAMRMAEWGPPVTDNEPEGSLKVGAHAARRPNGNRREAALARFPVRPAERAVRRHEFYE